MKHFQFHKKLVCISELNSPYHEELLHKLTPSFEFKMKQILNDIIQCMLDLNFEKGTRVWWLWVQPDDDRLEGDSNPCAEGLGFSVSSLKKPIPPRPTSSC